MPFVKATIDIKPASVGTGIKAALRRGSKSAAKLTIGITSVALASLGWKAGEKIEIMIGDGEHHGLLRLRKNNSVGQVEVVKRETAKGSWYPLMLGHQRAFVDRNEPAQWCQWEDAGEEGWIEIVLPKWADETAPRKPAAVAPQSSRPSPVSTAIPATSKRSVTAAVMGDPPPGRREMLERVGKIGS